MMQISGGQVKIRFGKMKFKYGEVDMDKLIFEPSCVPEAKRQFILQSLWNGYSMNYGPDNECIKINDIELSAQDLGVQMIEPSHEEQPIAEKPDQKRMQMENPPVMQQDDVVNRFNKFKDVIKKHKLTGDEMVEAIFALIRVHGEELGKAYREGILSRTQKAKHHNRYNTTKLQELLANVLSRIHHFENYKQTFASATKTGGYTAYLTTHLNLLCNNEIISAECPYGVVNVAKLLQRLSQEDQMIVLRDKRSIRSIRGTSLIINTYEFPLPVLLACLEPEARSPKTAHPSHGGMRLGEMNSSAYKAHEHAANLINKQKEIDEGG